MKKLNIDQKREKNSLSSKIAQAYQDLDNAITTFNEEKIGRAHV